MRVCRGKLNAKDMQRMSQIFCFAYLSLVAGGRAELAKYTDFCQNVVCQENMLSIKNTFQNPEYALYSSPPQLNDQLCENHHNPNESLVTFCQAKCELCCINC